MSRTTKDTIRQRPEQHRDAPFWRYGWWLRHGSKRSSAALRRLHSRIRRARVRAALRTGREPPVEHRDLPWVFW